MPKHENTNKDVTSNSRSSVCPKGLVTKYREAGGATKWGGRGGGACEVLPLQNGGGGWGGNRLAMLKGGHTKFLGNLYAVA